MTLAALAAVLLEGGRQAKHKTCRRKHARCGMPRYLPTCTYHHQGTYMYLPCTKVLTCSTYYSKGASKACMRVPSPRVAHLVQGAGGAGAANGHRWLVHPNLDDSLPRRSRRRRGVPGRSSCPSPTHSCRLLAFLPSCLPGRAAPRPLKAPQELPLPGGPCRGPGGLL